MKFQCLGVMMTFPIRHTVDLLASAFPAGGWPELPEAPREGVCCVSGAVCETIARKHVFGGSFTDLSGMRAPLSDRVGVSVFVALKYAVPRPGKKKPMWPEMNESWWCDGVSFVILDRVSARGLILGGVQVDRPWAGWITTTKKKHGAMRAPVNCNGAVWAFDEHIVDCSGDRPHRWYARLVAAQDAGIGRQSIETLDMPAGVIRKTGAETWLAFVHWARPRAFSPLYKLLCYLLPTQAERTGK